MRPNLLNPLFAAITTLPGVGPKQDKLFRYLLGREETPRLVDLLLHLPASVIDRRARPKIRDVVPGTVVTLEVTVDRHRPTPARNHRALRSRGVTPRSTIDTIIATFCIAEGHDLLHCDRDFDPFERHLGLRVLRT